MKWNSDDDGAFNSESDKVWEYECDDQWNQSKIGKWTASMDYRIFYPQKGLLSPKPSHLQINLSPLILLLLSQ